MVAVIGLPRRRQRPLRRLGARGTTAVEFAFMAGLLCTLVLTTIDVGRYFADQHAIDYGVAAAARYAAVNSGSATTSSITSKFDAAVSGLLGDAPTFDVAVSFAPDYQVGGNVTVAATYQWNGISPLALIGSRQITAAATMTVVH